MISALQPTSMPSSRGLASVFEDCPGAVRDARGRPRVMYVFPSVMGTGGGEILFRRRIAVARQGGLAPIAVVPDYVKGWPEWARLREELSDTGIAFDFARYYPSPATPGRDGVLPMPEEEWSVRRLLRRHAVALVHTGGYVPAFGFVCGQRNIPHVASSYIVDDDYLWPAGCLPFRHCDLVQSDTVRYAQKWGELFGSEWFCARDVAPEELFDLGQARRGGAGPGPRPLRPRRLAVIGTVMPRKCQLETIQALALLRERHALELRLFGLTQVDAPYFARCREAVRALRLGEQVRFEGFVHDLRAVYGATDIVVSASTHESLPNSIKEAMASRALVVASRAGGIAEVLSDGVNAILTRGSQPAQIAEGLDRALRLSRADEAQVTEQAGATAVVFHPQRALVDLKAMYAIALRERARFAPTRGRGMDMALAQSRQTMRGGLARGGLWVRRRGLQFRKLLALGLAGGAADRDFHPDVLEAGPGPPAPP